MQSEHQQGFSRKPLSHETLKTDSSPKPTNLVKSLSLKDCNFFPQFSTTLTSSSLQPDASPKPTTPLMNTCLLVHALCEISSNSVRGAVEDSPCFKIGH